MRTPGGAMIRWLVPVASLVTAVLPVSACDGGSAPSSNTGRPAPATTAASAGTTASTGPPATPPPTASSPAATPPAAVASACPRSADWAAGGHIPERQGIGQGATLWALFFPEGPTLRAGQELKVVWRMTGHGNFTISATGPTGGVVQPIWGPEGHPSSSWTRPGDEWGTGWVFPAAGCWIVTAKRDDATGYLVLRVAAAKP